MTSKGEQFHACSTVWEIESNFLNWRCVSWITGCSILVAHCTTERGHKFLQVFQNEIDQWFLLKGEKSEADGTCRRAQSTPLAHNIHCFLPEPEQLCTTLCLSLPCQISQHLHADQQASVLLYPQHGLNWQLHFPNQSIWLRPGKCSTRERIKL